MAVTTISNLKLPCWLTSLMVILLVGHTVTATQNQEYYIQDIGEYTAYSYDQRSVHHDMPQTSDYAAMSGRIAPPKCVPIPTDLTLCQDIGYSKMYLPNLLEHDTMKEVIQQSSSWVPLERIKCHPNTKIFLCSLFAPICLDRAIYPCRSLCLGVKASCEGRMKAHGFEWPEMLDCDQFQEDHDMCINVNETTQNAENDKCEACSHPMTHEAIIDHYCRSDIAIRATLKELKDVNSDRELILRKKRRLLKTGPNVSKKDVRSLRPIIKNGANCNCDNMNQTHNRYLIMGNQKDGDLILNFGMVWNRKDKEFRKGLRAMRKGNLCEGGIFKEISSNGLESVPSTTKKDRKKRRNKGKNKKDKKDKKKKGKKKRGGKKGGKKGKKGRKGRKGKKNRKEKGNDNSNQPDNRMTKAQREDQALSNFEKVAK